MTSTSPKTALASFPATLSFAEAGRVIIQARFHAMWRHREGVLRGDVDAVHDMRVGSRRLRAALDVFAAAFPGAEFRRLHRETARLTDELGAVRDHDVMLERLRRLRRGLNPREDAGLASLAAAIEAERTAARVVLVAFFAEVEALGYARRMVALFGAPDDADENEEGATDG